MKRFLMIIAVSLIAACCFAFTVAGQAHAKDITSTTDTVTERSMFNAGDFFWNDLKDSNKPLQISVNLSTQMLYVTSDGMLIAASSVSSGRDGYETPVGTFTVLGKEDNHWSTKYKAGMPYTMWLTNTGIALHSGGTPGHRSSHGCVHLPDAFAHHLYQVMHTGTVVTITGRQPVMLWILIYRKTLPLEIKGINQCMINEI